MNLDHELRRALARKDPPAGFERTLMARIASGAPVRRMAQPRWRHRALLPVAASLILTFGGTYYLQQRQEQRAHEQRLLAERATTQVTLALRIASEKLAMVQSKVQEMNQHEPQTQP